jgi:4-amino-4-deoxy-L-arabinose transferase-like glycosyltransferase
MKFRESILLLVLIMFGAFTRIVDLEKLPPGLSADEAYLGYQAYSIVTSGYDEWGKGLLQSSFRGYGEYKPPIIIYLVSLSTWLFGKNYSSIRIMTAAFGVLTIPLTYLMVRELSKKKLIALLASVLLLISPWHLSFSRHAYENNIAIFFTVLQVWAFLVARKRSKYIYLSFLALVIVLYLYHSNRIINPLLMLGMSVLYRKMLRWRDYLVALVIAVVLVVPVGIALLSVSGQARFRQTAFTRRINPTVIVQTERDNCWQAWSRAVCVLVSNKYRVLFGEYIKNYLDHYSPSILFINGTFLNRHTVPDRGLMYLSMFPFVLLGIGFIIAERKKSGLLILFWLAVYPIPSSFSGVGELTRMQVLMPLLCVLAAYGIWYSTSFLSRWLKNLNWRQVIISGYWVGIIGMMTLAAFRFAFDYTVVFPRQYYRYFNLGYRELVDIIKRDSLLEQYDAVLVLSGYSVSSHHFAYELPFPPNIYLSSDIEYYRTDEGFINILRFGRLYFNSQTILPKLLAKYSPDKVLVISNWNSGSVFRKGSTRTFSILSPHGEIIFEAAPATEASSI